MLWSFLCGDFQGQVVLILCPRYDPRTPDQHRTTVTVGAVLAFMGRELRPLKSAPAGFIVGILGLGEHIIKTATLSSSIACSSFTPMYSEAKALVQVALDVENIKDLAALRHGLR